MNENDLKNIEVVFAIARKELALDENQLLEIIDLKRRLFNEIKNEEETNLKVEE
jgi:hypothetical protein